MSKEDIQYLITLIQYRLRGWVELPPDKVIREIIDDLWQEFLRINQEQLRSGYGNTGR